MSVLELVIWSMAMGAMGAVVLFGAVEAAVNRSRASAQALAYHLLTLLFVFFMSGLPGQIWPALDPHLLRIVQVVIGPACNAMGDFWVRGWLQARQRDGVMASGLRAGAFVTPLAGVACLALPWDHQLPASAAVCLLNGAMLLWLTVRAHLLGDRLALGMAAGGALALPAIAGLYGQASGVWELGTFSQGVVAFCAVVFTGSVGLMVWLRSRQDSAVRAGRSALAQLDPLTQLFSAFALVQKLVRAQRRRRSTGRDGAVVAIIVFDTENLAAQVGASGLNELFVAMGHRIQSEVGVVNPVGRYWERCFIVLVETIPTPAHLRTLGLRIASALRRPLDVSGANRTRIRLQPDVGVGIVHLTPGSTAVEDILHDAQRLAEFARGIRSRAAVLDPHTETPVPVEDADFGGRTPPRPAAPLVPTRA
ncbi:diguanylate cyclase domain-containing protein [Ramlibacter sp.]|uniref:diguanylate cyclase domain-containing protein n=1 Tax=Ramlibacter sp. TaxID=1917967 RepID=UPI003D12338F